MTMCAFWATRLMLYCNKFVSGAVKPKFRLPPNPQRGTLLFTEKSYCRKKSFLFCPADLIAVQPGD